jgi:SAM-dependent methyltransferase
VKTASAPRPRISLVGGCVRETGSRTAPPGSLCRWCGATGLEVRRSRGDQFVLRCDRCDFLTLKTGLDEARLGETYQDYLPTDPAAIVRWEREQRPVVRRAVRAIGSLHARRHGAGGGIGGAPLRLLEIGSGFGFFLKAARDAGMEVAGVEFSAKGRAHARERFGIEVRAGPFDAGRFAAAAFDVVCAFYVVEHLADPRAFLASVRRLLKPGGLIFLRWPHSTPLARLADALGVAHDLYHAPWHLSDFTPATMERALTECGFSGATTRTFGGTATNGPLGTLLSRGAAALSDGLEVASGARLHLTGVSKTTFGWK